MLRYYNFRERFLFQFLLDYANHVLDDLFKKMDRWLFAS